MHKQSGFSLIEVAVVLVIMALFIGGILSPLGTRIEQSKITETSSRLDEIKQAIMGYAMINTRLPCPDTNNDGQEDIVGGVCSNAEGEPPWATLGMSQFDTWGNPYVYRVTATFADTTVGTGCVPNTTVASFALCSVGDINVYTDSTLANPVALQVAAVILSTGKVRPPPADELENTNSNTNFVSRDYRPDSSPSPFNDIVVWIPSNILVGQMVKAQWLP